MTDTVTINIMISDQCLVENVYFVTITSIHEYFLDYSVNVLTVLLESSNLAKSYRSVSP